ncbi:hypothetical protein Q4F19_17230 [Sphingomonas sp. BIUV-7]|uniref:MFS transporter n=1 Tax=Sphingomonas natans TaxID=3063330 RepID=A0ABT8YCR7_9SPHN|nr:hypothetical protein [Sphingomonas sp. BIUV-7]MDO6416132.1 hypothetical protein [Sphingomonas sp. BIUV-7]
MTDAGASKDNPTTSASVPGINIDKKPSNVAIYSAIVSSLALVGTIFNTWFASFSPANLDVQLGNTAAIAL